MLQGIRLSWVGCVCFVVLKQSLLLYHLRLVSSCFLINHPTRLGGWWFGNKLGGTQVWSHCADKGLVPPSLGWKIPWDGQA